MKRKSKIKAEELCCQHMYSKSGPLALSYVDERLLKVLDELKEKIFIGESEEILCNTYKPDAAEQSGKVYYQRGMVCNLCSRVLNKTINLTLYASDFINGKAATLLFMKNQVDAYTFDEICKIIEDNSSKLTYPITLKSFGTNPDGTGDLVRLSVNVYGIDESVKVTKL